MENNILSGNPDIEKTFKQFKVSCPVKKINMTLETPNAVAGMYIISLDEGDKYLKDKAELNDVNDNTILFFTNQQIVEVCDFLYGILNLFAENQIIKREEIILFIRETIAFCHTVPTYKMLKEFITTQVIKYFALPKLGTLMRDRFSNVMLYVWFISYATLDELAQEGVDSFRKSNPDSENKNE